MNLIGYLQRLGHWNYLALAILVFIEGPIATLAGAAAAATGVLKPEWVFITVSSSNLAADAFWYMLGVYAGNRWLSRIARKLGAKQKQAAQFLRLINLHAFRIIFTAKLTLSFSIPALIAAGMARIPLRKTFSALFPAEILWTGSLVMVGFYFGRFLTRLEWGLQIMALFGGALFVFLMFRLIRHYNAKKQKASDPTRESEM